jgi:hypothetical protein
MLLRDSLYFLGVLAIFQVFLYLNPSQWWMWFIMILIYCLYLMILSYDEDVKDFFYKFVGIRHEDDSFNADD